MEIINKKYFKLNKLGSGSFGSIFRGQNIRTKEYVAIKVEPIHNNPFNLLKNESKIYQYLNGCDNIPKIKWFGKDDENYYMIIELLGKSLQDLMNIHKKFSLLLILKIGIKIITIIKNIHEKELIHRDIKPDNFLFGIENKQTLYLIDFGFCKSYMNDGKHIQQQKTKDIIGSRNYASINSHNKNHLSRRDDLESLGYMLLYFFKGELPWNNVTDDDEIILLKKNIVYDENVPNIIIDFITYVRSLQYEEKPSYYLMIDNFKKEIETLSKNNKK
jgi:serine/threonine protein kinase